MLASQPRNADDLCVGDVIHKVGLHRGASAGREIRETRTVRRASVVVSRCVFSPSIVTCTPLNDASTSFDRPCNAAGVAACRQIRHARTTNFHPPTSKTGQLPSVPGLLRLPRRWKWLGQVVIARAASRCASTSGNPAGDDLGLSRGRRRVPCAASDSVPPSPCRSDPVRRPRIAVARLSDRAAIDEESRASRPAVYESVGRGMPPTLRMSFVT